MDSISRAIFEWIIRMMHSIYRLKGTEIVHLFHLDKFSNIFMVLEQFQKYYTMFSRISHFSYFFAAIFKLLLLLMQMIHYWKAMENAHRFCFYGFSKFSTVLKQF